MDDKQWPDRISSTAKVMQLPRYGWRYFLRHDEVPKISSAMFNICIIVSMNKGISQDGVAKNLKMDKSSVAKIVSKAITEGYLNRQVNQDDRREYCLEITELGQKSVDNIIEQLAKWQDEVMADFSEAERKEFESMVSRICEKAKEIEINEIQAQESK